MVRVGWSESSEEDPLYVQALTTVFRRYSRKQENQENKKINVLANFTD